MYCILYLLYFLYYQPELQPLQSPSILDKFLRHEKKVPKEFGTAEICVEMQVGFVGNSR